MVASVMLLLIFQTEGKIEKKSTDTDVQEGKEKKVISSSSLTPSVLAILSAVVGPDFLL